MTTPWLEAWLYPLGDVGTLDVSEDGGAAWKACTITTPAPARAALAELAAIATAWSPGGRTYTFALSAASGLAMSATGAWRLRLSASMGALLGVTTLEQAVTGTLTSDTTPLAWHAPAGVGYDSPRPMERVEVREYAHGRSSAYLSRHGRAVNITMHIAAASLDAVIEGPLGVHGLTRVYPTDPTVAYAYSREHLDGYLDIHPLELKAIDRPTWGVAELKVDALLLGWTPAVVTGRRWASLCAGLPFGFGVVYVAQVDGLAVLFMERAYDATAPAGYTLDPSLVVDTSARLGCLIDREETGIGQGYSLTLRLLDTATVRGLFRRPSVVTWLSEPVALADAAIEVVAPAAIEAATLVYIDGEALPYTAGAVVRGTYGPPRTHAAGAQVTDRPLSWRDRRVRLWAVAVDPTGRLVTSDGGLLTDAALVWDGFVGDAGAPAPRRVGAEWEIVCEPRDRKLRSPIGSSASGKARWALDTDPRVSVNVNTAVTIRVSVAYTDAYGVHYYLTIETVTLLPFAGMEGQGGTSLSRLREIVSAAWDAVRTDTTHLGQLRWRETPWPWDARTRMWSATVEFKPETTWQAVSTTVTVEPTSGQLRPAWHRVTTSAAGVSTLPTPLWAEAGTDLAQGVRANSATLEIALDKGDPADLPETGWIELEADDTVQVLRYTALEVGEDGIIRVTLASGYAPDLDLIAEDSEQTYTARFCWGDAGAPADVMRRMLESGGRGDNGTFDTLERGQGYDLDAVDEASFDAILDGAVGVLGIDLQVDSRTSFADLFGGLLVLSERAIVPRVNAAGTAIELAAVRTAAPGALTRAAVTITDADLVYNGQGQSPVRVLSGRPAPSRIEVTCKRSSRADDASIVVRDADRLAYQSPVTWDVTIYGIDRSDLIGPAQAFAQGFFRQGEWVQAIELDVVPWLDVVEGDEVALELSDTQLWQYSTGTPGYTGAARVIGRFTDPKTKVPTLTALCDGLVSALVLSPSAEVRAFTGTSTAPTALKVDRGYFPVFSRYLADLNPFTLRVVTPGADERLQSVTVSGVTDDGTHCVLALATVAGGVDIEVETYAESFEADAGDWLLPAEIVRATGATPTANTGPTAANAGSYYTYLEATGLSVGAIYYARGPALSLVGAHVATLTFAWHLYGADMGQLDLQASADGEAWATVWGEHSDQGVDWKTADVDLAAYLGGVVHLRFKCTVGASELSDMAWDDLRLTTIRARVTNPPSATTQGTTQASHMHTDTEGVWS